jgi:hypothetical protein
MNDSEYHDAGTLSSPPTRSAFAVACVPVALAIAIFVGRTRNVPLGGDEPHYLIMVDSIASDSDLDLHNNYLKDLDSRRIIGLTIPHVYSVESARGCRAGGCSCSSRCCSAACSRSLHSPAALVIALLIAGVRGTART